MAGAGNLQFENSNAFSDQTPQFIVFDQELLQILQKTKNIKSSLKWTCEYPLEPHEQVEHEYGLQST
jgi:hypothetical protein